MINFKFSSQIFKFYDDVFSKSLGQWFKNENSLEHKHHHKHIHLTNQQKRELREIDSLGSIAMPPESEGDNTGSFFSHELAVMVISSRTAFKARDIIRKTWASTSPNVFFVVGQHYCPIPHTYLDFGKP